jgi:molybdenum-dependent DNA-binding transcriptional regulator ModE
MRNPAFFREMGHLSDAGIEAIYKLFDEGCSIGEAAKRMGIPFRGAPHVVRHWAKHRNKLSLAEAGASPPATI